MAQVAMCGLSKPEELRGLGFKRVHALEFVQLIREYQDERQRRHSLG
jgi:hypothetical protein